MNTIQWMILVIMIISFYLMLAGIEVQYQPPCMDGGDEAGYNGRNYINYNLYNPETGELII